MLEHAQITVGMRQTFKPSLLLVEDEPALRRLYTLTLEKKGFRVTAVEDGPQALSAVEREDFDLMVCDLSLPGMDGWGVARAMKSHRHSREVPIVFLSAHGGLLAPVAQNAGAAGFLTKGLRTEELVTALKKPLEPRANFWRCLQGNTAFSQSLKDVGLRWTLLLLADQQFTGSLVLHSSGIGKATLSFSKGQLHQIVLETQSADHSPLEHVLTVAWDTCDVRFHDVTARCDYGTTTRELVHTACSVITADEVADQVERMVGAHSVKVNPTLLDIFIQLVPAGWASAARELCEAGLSPKEAIERLPFSPIQTDALLTELERRGVLSLH